MSWGLEEVFIVLTRLLRCCSEICDILSKLLAEKCKVMVVKGGNEFCSYVIYLISEGEKFVALINLRNWNSR